MKKKNNPKPNNPNVKYIKRNLLVKNTENVRKGLRSCSSNEHWKDWKSFSDSDNNTAVVLAIFNKNVGFTCLLLLFPSHVSHCV